MQTNCVPLSRSYLCGKESTYIAETLASGRMSGPGPQSELCEALIRTELSAGWAAIVPSCTAALEMSALLLDLKAGDEVIMPSFTFVSTANAVALRGAVPIFVDIEPATLNLCPKAVEAAITARTKAIFVVHYAGVVADMAALCAIASAHELAIVEDAAQAYGASRNGRMAGTFGVTSCFSFHGTKNISAGEAGALVVNNPELRDRAAILREKGTDRARFLQGLIDAYSWQDIGSSQIVSEITAAFLRAQLEQAASINAERLRLWTIYREALSPAESEGHFALPHPPKDAAHNGHIFFLMMRGEQARRDLAAHLAARGIASATHYVPLHTAPAGIRFGVASGALPVTQRTATCLLRLPMWNGLAESQHLVIEAVLHWCHTQRVAA
jgi:dTDP-4-amino-4,6-dideoxygalactose transaminase